jgi:hypothetical protein
MKTNAEPFKRANFFPGLQAGPVFWNSVVDYHFRKETLYNALFHGYGVVTDYLGALFVQAEKTKGGLLTLLVAPGLAFDGYGRPLFLYEPEVLVLDPRKFKLPVTVYVTGSYDEHLEEYYQNRENSDLQGYQKRRETVKLSIVDEVKDPDAEIELARIRLEEEEGGGVSVIRNTDSFCDPGINALDNRYVPWVNHSRKGVSRYLRDFMVEVLEYTRSVADSSCSVLSLNSLRSLQTVAMTGKMIMQTNGVGLDDVIHVISPLFDLDHQALFEIAEYERNHEDLGRIYTPRTGYENARIAMYAFGDKLKTFKGEYSELDQMLRQHQIVMQGLKQTLITREVSSDDIKFISHELPQVLLFAEQRYTLVDSIKFGSPESVESHNITFDGSAHPSISNESFFYPDGMRVQDTVRRWIGGAMRCTLRNIIKNRRLLIVRRTDIHQGNYTVTVEISGGPSTAMDIDGVDTKFRWRNMVASFDEGYVKDNTVELCFRIGQAGRDNSGTIWVYQVL